MILLTRSEQFLQLKTQYTEKQPLLLSAIQAEGIEDLGTLKSNLLPAEEAKGIEQQQQQLKQDWHMLEAQSKENTAALNKILGELSIKIEKN